MEVHQRSLSRVRDLCQQLRLGSSKLAGLTYNYALAPIGKGILSFIATACSLLWHFVSSSAQAIAKAAGFFYQHVLTPVGKGMLMCVCALCSGLWYCASTLAWVIVATANLLYENVLMPMGSCLQSLARSICTCLSALLQCIATIFTTVGPGVASVFQSVWANALVPVGQGIAHVISAIAVATLSVQGWCVSAIRVACCWFTQVVKDVSKSMTGL